MEGEAGQRAVKWANGASGLGTARTALGAGVTGGEAGPLRAPICITVCMRS